MMRSLAPLLLATIASLLSIQSAVASDPHHFAITNVRDTSFTVSWLTTVIEPGQVQLIGGETYPDERGTDFSATTHYVPITGLRTNSAYSFEIISGGKKYDNGGARWSVKTGATLTPRTPDWIGGKVQNPDGSVATDAIVSTTIGREQQGYISAPLSALIAAREGGIFRINLSETRSFSDPTSFFAYSIQGDRPMNNNVTIQAIAANGTEAFMLDMADPRLRASDTGHSLIVKLSPNTAIPTMAAQQPTLVQKMQSANSGTIWIGFVIIGVLVVASIALILGSLRPQI